MGTPRTRSRELTLHTPGYYQPGYYSGSGWVNLGAVVYGSGLANIGESSNDTLGPGPPFVEPHGLSLVKRKVVPLRYYGEEGQGFSWRRLYGYNPTNFTSYTYVTIPTATDMNFWKAKALASINPFKPQVDLPLFLFELREFPRMLRDLGHVLQGRIKPRDVPGGYLAYNFGWAPLVSDLKSLFNFAESIAKTRNALTNAANGSKVSHTLGGRSSTGLPTTYSYAGTVSTYQVEVSHKTSVKAWCKAHVHLTEPLPPLVYDKEMLAMKTAFGLNLRPAMLWDAIPFTWLIDYFTNMGDLMEARGGYNRWRFADLYIMVETTKTDQVTHTTKKLQSMSHAGGTMSYVRKERSYAGANPNVGISFAPMLSDYQTGIISALVTATALRSKR
jgi:hypothetical protein